MPTSNNEFHKLIAVIDTLLGPEGCPWDREQTVLSLSHMIHEEVCEMIDTLQETEPERLADELGDLLIGAVFLSKAAEKEKRFSWQRPFQKAAEKLVRRHPHIFAGNEKLTSAKAVEHRWEEIKATESEHSTRKSRFDGIPKSLPALAMMQKLLVKAKKTPSLYHMIEQLTQKKRDNEEEELARRIAKLIIEAEEKGIHAEHALRTFFSSCRKALVDQEQEIRASHSG